ncbi:MAG: relaxase/mobilization nuclease domain-containing protein [Eggerthellaceae bacterium]|nr:relaxase/mobilization nuclease domain-containing protein [Eggerthellaceae bacterium]
MDATREGAGNDADWRGCKAVTYRHFIISPSPEDNVSLETLRDLALSWVKENFADYQVAITYHDDNRNRIPHAHIIVNNTNLSTGRRLHLTDADTAALASSLQALALKRGLSHFENLPDSPSKTDIHTLADYVRARANVSRSGRNHRPSAQREYLSKAEREARDRGVALWKQDIRDRILVAMWASDGTEESFSSELSKLGILAQFRDDDILYITQDCESRRVRSSRLGTDFGRAGLIRISNVAARHAPLQTMMRASLSSYITDISVLSSGLSVEELKARRERAHIALNEVRDALETLSDLHIQSIDGVKRLLNATPTSTAEFDRERLEQALRVAQTLRLIPENSHRRQGSADTSHAGRIPLNIKVTRGYRLSKTEYASLRPAQMAAWRRARMRHGSANPEINHMHCSSPLVLW